MKNRIKIYYIIFAIGIFALTTVGATYAYWTSSASSTNNSITTNSTGYSINMTIKPLYHGFSFIPMNDDDVVKAITKECKDKYDRGACSAYLIDVFGYSEGLDIISGTINGITNIENLSYVIMSPKLENEDEKKCTSIEIDNETKEYCIYTPYYKFDGTEQIMIESYNVSNASSVQFILIVWLHNEDRSQNNESIGSFTASVTIAAGAGGRIQGVISDAIEIEKS